MNDYKPNSHRFKDEQKTVEEQRKVEKVVNGAVKTKKKSGVERTAEAIISDIITDIFIPAGKKLITDVAKNIFDKARDGIDTLLYGEYGKPRGDSPVKRAYSKCYDSRFAERSRFDEENRGRSTIDFDTITYDSRGEAEMVLAEMRARIVDYGMVTVSDMFEMSGLQQPYTSHKYGYTNLDTSSVERGRDGYIIKLPRVKSLD